MGNAQLKWCRTKISTIHTQLRSLTYTVHDVKGFCHRFKPLPFETVARSLSALSIFLPCCITCTGYHV